MPGPGTLAPQVWPKSFEEPGIFGREGTLYSVIGGIERLIQAGERFAASAYRNRPRNLTRRELQWLQVRLVQLLASAAGGPLEYSGPRLHELYAQHSIPPMLYRRFDEMVMEAMDEVHINRVFVRVIARIACDAHALGEEDFSKADFSQITRQERLVLRPV
jgi:truncated hemoglobin YjbI